jgi:hypothetical protein
MKNKKPGHKTLLKQIKPGSLVGCIFYDPMSLERIIKPGIALKWLEITDPDPWDHDISDEYEAHLFELEYQAPRYELYTLCEGTKQQIPIEMITWPFQTEDCAQ